MKNLALALILSCSVVSVAAVTTPSYAKAIEAEIWADNPEVSSVSLSPDGENLAMLQRQKRGGMYEVVTFETGNAADTFQRLDTGRLVPTSLFWVNSEILLVNLYEEVKVGRDINRVGRILAYNTKTKDSVAILDGQNKNSRSTGSVNAAFAAIGQGGLVSLLPKDPKHVMMQYREDTGAPNYYRVNVYDGKKTLVSKGNNRYGSFGFDDDGELRTGVTYEPDGPRIVSLARAKGGDDWVVMGEQDARERKRYNLFGFYDSSRPNIAIAAMDSEGGNFTKFFEQNVLNPSTKKMIYEKQGHDVGFPLTSPRMKDGRKIVGFAYHGKKRVEFDYIDQRLKNIYLSIRASFPSENINILNVSDDDSTVLFVISGPKNAGEYYMIKNGRAAKVASRYSKIDNDDLSPQELFIVKARDGRDIPTLVTIPKGAGAKKAIALPHGGPWSRDTYGFDTWAQMLANRGFVVVQPQFRGSTDLGLEHWVAGDNQWGLKMQDDVEDAMLAMVDKGLVNKDKMGILGWSFGGYTTNVAITRGNNLYKCAVSGAGISNVTQIAGGLTGSRYLRQYQKPTISGYSPIEHVENANIPVLIVHGNLDTTVDVRQSRRFYTALKDEGVDVEYIEIKNMYHNPATATRYKDYMTFYPEMLEFFDKKCGF